MIPQRSLDISEPFIIGNEGRDILGLRQNASWFLNSTHSLRNWEPPAKTISIARNKFMLMGINSTDSNPMGTSPLEQVWERAGRWRIGAISSSTDNSNSWTWSPLCTPRI